SARLLRGDAKNARQASSRRGFYALIDYVYAALLTFSMRHRIAVAIVALFVMASAIPLFGKVKQEFIPTDVDEAEFQVSITAPQDTSLASMDRAARQVERELLAMPGVQVVLTQVGGGFSGEVNVASYYVRIEPHQKRLF